MNIELILFCSMSFLPQVGVQTHTASHHSWGVLEWFSRSSAVLLHEGVGIEAWAGLHTLCSGLSCRRWGACSAVSWSRHHTHCLSRGTVEVSIRVGEGFFFFSILFRYYILMVEMHRLIHAIFSYRRIRHSGQPWKRVASCLVNQGENSFELQHHFFLIIITVLKCGFCL